MRRLVYILVFVLLAVGAGCIFHARSFPVYTDPDGPGRLSGELDDAASSGMPSFEDWYTGLRALETPHKRFADTGRGLCAAALGVFLSGGLASLYLRSAGTWSMATLLTLWWAFWLGRIPFTIWYYFVRQMRYEYPTWGDSIMIPIFSEFVSWVLGAVVTSVVLRLLFTGYSLPVSFRLQRPTSVRGWLRAVLIMAWLLLLGDCIVRGVLDGNEGQVLSCILASVVLVICLTAVRQKKAGRSEVAQASVTSVEPMQPSP